MDRTAVQATFALRLVADLMTALVISGVLPKKHATALIDDSTNRAVTDDPEFAEALRETAAALTAQIQLCDADVQNRLRRRDES